MVPVHIPLMSTKVGLITGIAVAAITVALSGLSPSSFVLRGLSAAPTTRADRSSGPWNPERSFEELKDGNARFVTGRRQFAHLDRQQIARTVTRQTPFAAVLSCSDSRVPVEHLLDVGIGDLFVIRVAGNVCSDDECGSLEYAVDHLNTPLVMVLGHTRCGAVTAVVEHAELEGRIPRLTEHIDPALREALAANPGIERDSLIDEAIRCNVRRAIADLLETSPSVRSRVASGALKVVGAIYDIRTGAIEWLDR
jgi:carbonic anhydrase